jgi:hypothetical protein
MYIYVYRGVTPVLRTGGLDAVGGSGGGYRDSREQKKDPRGVTKAYVDLDNAGSAASAVFDIDYRSPAY